MEGKRYEFTGEVKDTKDGVILRRIRFIRDVKDIKAGTVGGWIENEGNLYQYDDSLVLDEAAVYGSAQVAYDGIASGNAEIFDNTYVSGTVNKNAKVYGRARVHTSATVTDHAKAFGYAVIEPTICIDGHLEVDYRVSWLSGKKKGE